MKRGSYRGGSTVLHNGQFPVETPGVVLRKRSKPFAKDADRGESLPRPPEHRPAQRSAEEIAAAQKAVRTPAQIVEERRERIAREAGPLRANILKAISPLIYLTAAEAVRLDNFDLVLESFLDRPSSERVFISKRLGRILKDHIQERAGNRDCDVPLHVGILQQSGFLRARISEVVEARRKGQLFKAKTAVQGGNMNSDGLRRTVLSLLARATGVSPDRLRQMEVMEATLRQANTLAASVQDWVIGHGLPALENAITAAALNPDPQDPDAIVLPEALRFLKARAMPMDKLRLQVRQRRADLALAQAEALFHAVGDPPALGRKDQMQALAAELAEVEARIAKLAVDAASQARLDLEDQRDSIRYAMRGLHHAGKLSIAEKNGPAEGGGPKIG